jgi:hypothetical protein
MIASYLCTHVNEQHVLWHFAEISKMMFCFTYKFTDLNIIRTKTLLSRFTTKICQCQTNFNTSHMEICHFREINDDANLVMLSIGSILVSSTRGYYNFLTFENC